MSEKRYRIDYSDKIIDKETGQKYYFEDMEDWKKIVNLLNEYEENLQMCHEKALYWRNKAENIFGDMKTNVELQQENIRLKKELEKLKS